MDKTTLTPFWRRDAFLDWAIPLVLLVPAWLSLSATPRMMASGEFVVPFGAPVANLVPATGLSYLLVSAVFVPLVVRRRFPVAVLAVATLLSVAYIANPNPPAPVQLAPIVALYVVGTLRDRRTVWIGYAAATVFTLLMTVHPFAGIAWIPEAVSTLTAFGVAAALGDATRSRRAYVASVEQRAIDAERTREDEARRRVEEERLRIARELHDVTAHSLSIIALQAGAAERVVHRDPDSVVAALNTIRLTSKDSLDELRAMLGVLRGADEDAPLSPAGRLERLPELVAAVEQAGVCVTLDVVGDLGDVPAYADVSAYRIVQEALTNVARHANASSARVSVGRESDELVLEIADDGRAATAPTAAEGHGIVGMRERVAALGGTFEAGPVAEGGFRVAARLPLAKGAQRRDA
ncbi:MAG: sensor histidine kinase [Coriobacteriia bacterium]|nr:sensor histidine kinase [Coriobacteriia bacterium]